MSRKICIALEIEALSSQQLEILREAFFHKIDSDLFDIVISRPTPPVVAGDPDEIVIGFRFASE
jgi:hypothetical protein